MTRNKTEDTLKLFFKITKTEDTFKKTFFRWNVTKQNALKKTFKVEPNKTENIQFFLMKRKKTNDAEKMLRWSITKQKARKKSLKVKR